MAVGDPKQLPDGFGILFFVSRYPAGAKTQSMRCQQSIFCCRRPVFQIVFGLPAEDSQASRSLRNKPPVIGQPADFLPKSGRAYDYELPRLFIPGSRRLSCTVDNFAQIRLGNLPAGKLPDTATSLQNV